MYLIDQVLSEVTPRRVWWTPKGAAGCAKRVLSHAPDVSGWVMITLTVDRKKYSTPREAYEAIMKDFPRFSKALARLNRDVLRWARKMELQADGWPHWHLICNLRKLLRHELPLLDFIWTHGMTNITFLRDSRAVHYALKYCCKPISDYGQEQENYGLPDWVLDFPTRIRWWQTHDFYEHSALHCDDDDDDDDDDDTRKRPKITIRQQINAKKNMLQVIGYDRQTQVIAWRKIYSLAFQVRPLMLAIVRRFHCPGCPDLLHLGLQRNLNIRINKWPTNLPLLTMPGRVFVSLDA